MTWAYVPRTAARWFYELTESGPSDTDISFSPPRRAADDVVLRAGNKSGVMKSAPNATNWKRIYTSIQMTYLCNS